MLDFKRCKNCKKDFYRPIEKSGYLRSAKIWRNQHFCGLKCVAIFMQSPRKRKIEGKYIKKCVICGNNFSLPEIRKGKFMDNLHWNNKKTCSDSCSKKLGGLSRKGRKRPSHSTFMVNFLSRKENWTKSDTNIERLIEKFLKEHKIKYLKQQPIMGIAIVDFYIPSLKTIIECDGNYWHNLPGAKERDEIKTQKMINGGYKVFRFWEKDIIKSASNCVNQVLK